MTPNAQRPTRIWLEVTFEMSGDRRWWSRSESGGRRLREAGLVDQRGDPVVVWALALNRFAASRTGWYITSVIFTIELEREEDGRWLAEVPGLAGVLCYGANRGEAIARIQALALRVIAERLEHSEAPAELLNVVFQAA